LNLQRRNQEIVHVWTGRKLVSRVACACKATNFHFAPWQPAELKGNTRGHSVDRWIVEPSAQEPGESSRVDGQKVILKVRFVVA